MKGLGPASFVLGDIISSERQYFQRKLDRPELEEIIPYKIIWSHAVIHNGSDVPGTDTIEEQKQ